MYQEEKGNDAGAEPLMEHFQRFGAILFLGLFLLAGIAPNFIVGIFS